MHKLLLLENYFGTTPYNIYIIYFLFNSKW